MSSHHAISAPNAARASQTGMSTSFFGLFLAYSVLSPPPCRMMLADDDGSARRWLVEQETQRQREVRGQIEQCLAELRLVNFDGLKSAIVVAQERYNSKLQFQRRPSAASQINSMSASGSATKSKGASKHDQNSNAGGNGKTKAKVKSQMESLAEAVEIIDRMSRIKGVKGHLLAVEFILELTKQRAWQLRHKALAAIPLVAPNGQLDAMFACIERLSDWHDEVRRAAVSCFRDSPGLIKGRVKAAKDLFDLGPGYDGGSVVCILGIIGEDGQLQEQFETTGSEDAISPFWNQDFSLLVGNPDTAICEIKIVRRGCKEVRCDVLVASAQLPVYELSDNKDKALWIPLKRDALDSGAAGAAGDVKPLAPSTTISRRPSSELVTSGSLQVTSTLTLGRGIGIKGEMQGVIELLQPALYDTDYRIRREALNVFSEHVNPGDYEYTQLLINAFHDRNAEVRWAAVDGFRRTLSGLDPSCCMATLESIVPLLQTDATPEFHLACMEIIQIAGPANPAMCLSGPGSARMIQLIVSRLNHPDPMIRRSAITAFEKVVPVRSREAIATILPFLSDDNSGVRMAAFSCILKVSDSNLKLQGPPRSEDIETLRAVIEGLDILRLDDGIDSVRQDVYDHVGLHFALAFSLGIHHDHRAGWDSSQHCKLGHIKRWADGEWHEIKRQEEADFERRKAERFLVDNYWVKKASRVAGYTNVSEYEGSLTQEQQMFIGLAQNDASAAIQSNWKRFRQQTKFVSIIKNNRESAMTMFAAAKGTSYDGLVVSSGTPSGTSQRERPFAGLEKCLKVLVPSPTLALPASQTGIECPSSSVHRQQSVPATELNACNSGRFPAGQTGASSKSKIRPREIPLPNEYKYPVTLGAKRLGLSKHIAIAPPHAVNKDLSSAIPPSTSLPLLTPERAKNWGTPSRHAMRARHLVVETMTSPHTSDIAEISISTDGPEYLQGDESFVSRHSNYQDVSHPAATITGSFKTPHSAPAHHRSSATPLPNSNVEDMMSPIAKVPSQNIETAESYISTTEEGVIILRKLGLKNAPRLTSVESKKAAFTGGSIKSLAASVNSSEKISPRHVTNLAPLSGSDEDTFNKLKGRGNKKPSTATSQRTSLTFGDPALPSKPTVVTSTSFLERSDSGVGRKDSVSSAHSGSVHAILGNDVRVDEGGWLDYEQPVQPGIPARAASSRRRFSSTSAAFSPEASNSGAPTLSEISENFRRQGSSTEIIRRQGSSKDFIQHRVGSRTVISSLSQAGR